MAEKILKITHARDILQRQKRLNIEIIDNLILSDRRLIIHEATKTKTKDNKSHRFSIKTHWITRHCLLRSFLISITFQ